METKDIISLTLGSLGSLTGIAGLVLGIINTWKAHSKDKVKLRISVGWAMDAQLTSGFHISVTNLSVFPVTISEVGVQSIANQTRSIDSYLINSGKLPVRLEPRTRVGFTHQPAFHKSADFQKAEFAYVLTECGTEVRDTKNLVPIQVEVAKEAAKKGQSSPTNRT